jgi:hypothetical protein
MDYSAYQLTSVNQIKELRQKHGERFRIFEDQLYQKLGSMPADIWIDYTAWVHPQNLERAVKVICYWMQCCNLLGDYYTFNKDFTRIQRTIDPQLLKL